MQLHIEDILDCTYQSIDGYQIKALLSGEIISANPTDRSRGGVKRHLLTEADGLPEGLIVTEVSVHDVTQV